MSPSRVTPSSSVPASGACPEVLARVAMAVDAVPAGLDPETCARHLHEELTARGFGRAELLSLAASLIARVSGELEGASVEARRRDG